MVRLRNTQFDANVDGWPLSHLQVRFILNKRRGQSGNLRAPKPAAWQKT